MVMLRTPPPPPLYKMILLNFDAVDLIYIYLLLYLAPQPPILLDKVDIHLFYVAQQGMRLLNHRPAPAPSSSPFTSIKLLKK